jgi:hypothetical protein
VSVGVDQGHAGAAWRADSQPQFQLEEVNRHARIKKDAESGDPAYGCHRLTAGAEADERG